MSCKVVNSDRLALLSTSVNHLSECLVGSRTPLYVVDSSLTEHIPRTAEVWRSCSLPTTVEAKEETLTDAYRYLLDQTDSHYFYMHFDDMVVLGLSEAFLDASVTLLDRYRGLVSVVRPHRASSVTIDHGHRLLTVTSEGWREGAKRYWIGKDRSSRVVAIEHIHGFTFGIFKNHGYGFMFGPLVAPRVDYQRRLEWYMRNVSAESVHEIEHAARTGLRGPSWRHVAVCLSGVVRLDLDYSHTMLSVRAERPEQKELFLAFQRGYETRLLSASDDRNYE